jgi:phosphoribosylformylglycinamidine synthase PurS subunit
VSASLYSARVLIRLQSGVNDPQGLTVLGSLRDIGHDEVRGVRVGKVIDLQLQAADEEQARELINQMCRDLLVNPVIESYEVELHAGEQAGV